MPNDTINGFSIPLPHIDSFDTLNDLVNAIKSYCKEAGFSIVIEDRNSQYSRTIRCSKSVDLKV